MQTKLLINGALVGGEGTVERVLDPATGKCIAEVAEASRAQMDAAVSAAEAAGPGWAQTVPKDRAALLLRLADRIEADAAAFAKLESDNAGKPLSAALERRDSRDCRRVSLLCRRRAHATRRAGGRVPAGLHEHGAARSGRRRRLDRALELSADDGRVEIGPALAAGNTVVLKPSEQTPLTALKLAQTLAELVPHGRRQHHLRSRRDASVRRWCRIRRVRMVSLTGDVATGQKILAPPRRAI